MNSFLTRLMRTLPSFKGKLRLTRLLFRKQINTAQDVTVQGKFGCSYLLPNLKESIAFDIFANGIYEQDTHDFLMRRLPRSAVLLDLGANIGSISIPLLKQRSDIGCVCVEASPWVYKYLQRNYSLNKLPDAALENLALWSESGLQLPFYSPAEQFGKGSLSSSFSKEAVMVESISIDDLLAAKNIRKVDFIKIDIEGYEYHAFKGAQKLLTGENAPEIFFEYVDWAQQLAGIAPGEEQTLLKSFGYKIYEVNASGDKTLLENNFTKGSCMLLASKA